MTKKELRTTYRQKRTAISDTEKMKLDDLLLIQFQRLAFEDIHVLLSYMPMQHTAEPDTQLCTRYLRHSLPGLQVAYPVIGFAAGTMQAVLTQEGTLFVKNAYNILEPPGGQPVAPQEIDVVFVPLLICDQQGQRVGYGKGYYDRYLYLCRSDVIKVGFSYFEPVESIDDIHRFDIPLNYCITPQHIYEF